MRTNHTPGPWAIGVSHVAGEYAIREGADPTDREPAALVGCLEALDVAQDRIDGDLFGVHHNQAMDAMDAARNAIKATEAA